MGLEVVVLHLQHRDSQVGAVVGYTLNVVYIVVENKTQFQRTVATLDTLNVSDLHGLTELILLPTPCPTSFAEEDDRVDILSPEPEPHQQLTAGSHVDYASIPR